MPVFSRPWGAMHYTDHGSGPAVVFANSLGTDLRLWQPAIGRMMPGLRLVCFDKRGHGLSDLPKGATSIADYADDAIALIEDLGLERPVFVGLSIGGMIAQSIAIRRPDLLAGVVLSNSAARIGSPQMWQARCHTVLAHGIASIADAVLERWFAPDFRATAECAIWRNMLIRTPADGYAAACTAIAAADFTADLGTIRLPVMAIAGASDGATPPDLVADTARRISGARFHTIAGAGHLPCIEAPAAFAALLNDFLKETGHV